MSAPCTTCHIKFGTREELFAHFKSEFHRTNLVLISKQQPTLTLEQFDEIQKAKQAEMAAAKAAEEEDQDHEEFKEELCRDIPETECLFCGRVFETPELTYEHMTSHGFRFCYPERLKDKDGLLRYFGEKIGVGHCCLECCRQFQSLRSVRDHMLGKRHCDYECDDETDEFYSQDTSIVPFQGTVDQVGEIHFPDGKIYGHRMFMRYYRQRIPDPEEFKKTARIAICGPTAPRESISIDHDVILQEREFFKQKYISKRERRLVSKDYHPFTDIHRGNA